MGLLLYTVKLQLMCENVCRGLLIKGLLFFPRGMEKLNDKYIYKVWKSTAEQAFLFKYINNLHLGAAAFPLRT